MNAKVLEKESFIVQVENNRGKKKLCSVRALVSVLAMVAVAAIIAVLALTGVGKSTEEVLPMNVTTSLIQKTTTEKPALPPNPDKIDCLPDYTANGNASVSICAARGCLWNPSMEPRCFYPVDFGYIMTSYKDGLISLKKQDQYDSPFGSDIQNVAIKYEYLHLKRGSTTPEINVFHFSFHDQDDSNSSDTLDLSKMTVKESNSSHSKTFAFKIVRKSTGTILWDTTIGGFVYSNQFMQISTHLPSANVYGLGEQTHQTFKHNFTVYKTWPAFARDEGPWSEEEDFRNLYGAHPFYLCIEPDGKAHGVLLLNSNAMEFTLGPTKTLTYRTIGGILDFYLFAGPTPDDVIQQYHAMIGFPMLPAYWSLGFQLCKYGYKDTQEIKDVVNRTIAYGIPLDVQYGDIDYMDRCKDFTMDAENFGDLPEFVAETQAQGLKWIFILDPAINVNSTPNDRYGTFDRGLANNVYITWPNKTYAEESNLNFLYKITSGTSLMLGTVWPDNNTAFPDYMSLNTSVWWNKELELFHKMLPFDGIWIDMNEPANFGTNDPNPWYFAKADHPNTPQLFCPINKYDDPPYKTQMKGDRLSDKTICMIGQQSTGSQVFNHYDVHNLYGWSESVSTFEAVQKVLRKRSIVISRSTFPSSGRYVGHWLGDNSVYWSDLRTSITGMFEFDMFGMPYIGADICGFYGNTTEELCLRWQQVGAFYPFARNHNSKGYAPQDPAVWPSVARATRQALEFRYHYLPLLYTLMYQAHQTGSGVVRPLAFDFPMDPVALNIDAQFLWGHELLFTPVITPGASEVQGYFPAALWYALSPPESYGKAIHGPRWVSYMAPNTTMFPVHVKGGSIIPRQMHANNTEFSRKKPFELLIALDKNGRAEGHFYWDQGDNLEVFGDSKKDVRNSYWLKMSFVRNKTEGSNLLTVSSYTGTTRADFWTPTIDILEVFGVKRQPDLSSLKLDGTILKTNGSVIKQNGSTFWLKIPQMLHLDEFQKISVSQIVSVLSWNDMFEA